MADIKVLEAVYKEKQAKFQALSDAVVAAYEAHQAIKAMCDEAMADMQKAGEEYLRALNS